MMHSVIHDFMNRPSLQGVGNARAKQRMTAPRAGLLLLLCSFLVLGANCFVRRAVAANSPDRETAGELPPAMEAKQPEDRASGIITGDPPGSRELTRELRRLLRPEQAAAPDKKQAPSAKQAKIPEAAPPAEPKVRPHGAALSMPEEPVPALPPDVSAAEPSESPATAAPQAPEAPRPKAPSAPLAKAAVMASPKIPEVPKAAPPTEPKVRLQKTISVPEREDAKSAALSPEDGSAVPTPAEPRPKAGAPLHPGKKAASLPTKGPETASAGRAPEAASLSAGSGEKPKPPDAASSTGKGSALADSVSHQNVVRAEIRSVNITVLSAPYDGVISVVLARDGDRADKGQVMARLDAHAEEQAFAAARTLAADAFNRLGVLPEGPSRERDALAAEYMRHSAEARVRETRLARSEVNAPFAGTVTDVRVKAGEHVKQGAPIVEIAESGSLEIVCEAPSAWIRWLKPGHVVWVYVDETAKSYEAILDRLGGKVDPVSKTLKVYARFSSPQGELLPGMSGSASIRPRLAEEKGGAKQLP